MAATEPGSWFFLHVANPIDSRLIPLTRGYLSVAVGQPVLVLEHTGAKTGQRRRTPLLYATDGEDVIVIASAGGARRHPAWLHNLRAHPRVRLFLRGRSGEYTAREAKEGERARLWRKATAIYPGYDTYQVRAGAREIPVVVLSPAR
ncbi:MAG: nitroreductase family deazaflavin-dependent oxidoreductase [Actinobacteria bacterium]|nr:nitroreductase family deazaflavin-dependent oxidoreductase [Actinomycetota bacterium]